MTSPYQQPPGAMPHWQQPVPPEQLRHPLDPDVRTSTKATGVLALGIAAVCLMFCVGGIVPAALALTMARSARAELEESEGFLSGDRSLRLGVLLSWIALAGSIVVLVVFLIVVLLTYGADPASEFGENVD